MGRPRIAPVVWQPPPAPPRAWQPQSDVPLPTLTTVPVPGAGPEDVAVDDEGRVVTGVEDGRILRVTPADSNVEVLCDTGGRPLGVEALGGDAFVICDAYRGLLRLAAGSGRIDVLCDTVDGERLLLCDNAAVAADGTIYFSDSSQRFTVEHWKADLLEHSGTGRLLRRNADGTVEVLLRGLQFANGVALAPDESFVAVAETGAYCVRKLHLTGERAGSVEMLVENLPGFVDNVSTGTDGLLWLAIASRRDATLDRLAPRAPLARRFVWSLPEFLIPGAVPTVWVMAVDVDGRVVHDLQAPGDRLSVVTGVRERNGRVYLGSLVSSVIGLFDLPPA